MNDKCIKKERGFALLSALFIVLIIASLATVWISQTHHHLKILHLSHEIDEAHTLSESANIWVSEVLMKRRFASTNPLLAQTDGKIFKLPQGYRLNAQLIDAQSQFNLNSINEESMRLSFFLLLKDILGLQNKAELETLYFATLTWINKTLAPARAQLLQTLYANKKPPYQMPNQMMQSMDEWRNVAGMTPRLFSILQNDFTALPQSTPININTCSEKIIKNLRADLSDEDVKKILFVRGTKGFRSPNELFAVLQTFKIPVQNTTIMSQYFWLELDITTPSQRHIRSKSLFYRPLQAQNQKTIVLKLQEFKQL